MSHIQQKENLVRIANNVGWQILDKLVRNALGLIVGVWVIRYLGPTQFGLFSFASALIDMFGAIAGLGLQSIVVRDIVRDPKCKNETLGTAAALLFISGLVSYSLLLGTIFFLRPDDSSAKILTAILGSAFIFKTSEIAIYWFDSQVLSKYIVWVQNGCFIVFSAIKILLIISGSPMVSFAWAALSEALAIALLMLVILNSYGTKIQKLRYTYTKAKILMMESLPLLLGGIVLIIQARIDQIMLGQIIGDHAVAQYSAALRIIELASMGSMILYNSFAPSIILAKNTSEESYIKKLMIYYEINMFSALLLTLFIGVLALPIINLLYGKNYTEAGSILTIMSIRLFLTHIGVQRGIYLLSEKMLRYSALTLTAGALLNIVLNYILIPKYGGIGAAIASLISFLTSVVFIDIFHAQARINTTLMFKALTPFNLARSLKRMSNEHKNN